MKYPSWEARSLALASLAGIAGATIAVAQPDPGEPFVSPPPPDPDYNVLLVVIDDIGVEWFDFYGLGQQYTTDPAFRYCTTPRLNGLVQNGILFTEAYAAPICGPTRACLLTGRYGLRTGFGENIRDPTTVPVPTSEFGGRLSPSYTSLPRAIQLARPGVYDTGMIGKWHLCDGYSSVVHLPDPGPSSPPPALPAPDVNLDHAVAMGYDFSAIHIPNYGGAYSWYRIEDGVVDPPQGFIGPPNDTTTWAPSVHVTDALAWINDPSRTGPWFLNLAFNAPHAYFTVPPFSIVSTEMQAELIAAGYGPGSYVPTQNASYETVKLIWRASMECVDHCIGEVLDGMTPEVRANTMVVVVGDNGTVGNALPPGFLHQKREVYRGGTQVPMIVSGPLVVGPGRQSNALVHSVDVYATVLDVVHAQPAPDVLDYDGVSFLPVIRNTPGARHHVYVESFGPWGLTDTALQADRGSRAVFDGQWRYVARDGFAPELYHDDPTHFLEDTSENVIAGHPDKAAELQRKIDEILGS